MRHHSDINKHLIIRCDRLRERLDRDPSFIPVGRQEVRDLAQWRLDSGTTDVYQEDFQETVIASFRGTLPELTLWTICNIKIKQI